MAEDKKYYQQYLFSLHTANQGLVYNADTAKAWDKHVKKSKNPRPYFASGAKIKNLGPDIVTTPRLDQAVIGVYCL